VKPDNIRDNGRAHHDLLRQDREDRSMTSHLPRHAKQGDRQTTFLLRTPVSQSLPPASVRKVRQSWSSRSEHLADFLAWSSRFWPRPIRRTLPSSRFLLSKIGPWLPR